MSIESLGNEVGKFMVSAFEAGKEAVLWTGRMISKGYNYVHPTIAAIWSKVLIGLEAAFGFLKTGFGLATLGFALGGVLLLISDLKSLRDHYAKYVLQALAVVCFISGFTALLLGTVAIL